MGLEERKQVRVRIRGAVKRFDDVTALDHVTLDVEPGRFFFLLGPSGCGKTTLLRAMAGLVDLDEGAIWFDDRDVTRLAAHKRNTALVFQSYALWPHMTVFDNVAFGLVERKVPRRERDDKVRSALDMVRLGHLSGRRPNELSGGQQQRVALARALVVEPDLVLLDEPLSNLDANLRRQMRYELKRIQEQTGITMVYVTHDQSEALSMAHRMAVMKDGRVVQTGTPEEVYRSPRSIFVAGFVGRTNFVPGRISDVRGELVCADTPLGPIWGRGTVEDLPVGTSAVCSIRPEHLDWSGSTTEAADVEAVTARPSAEDDQDQVGAGIRGTTRISATMTGRLFLGEVEERRYRTGDLELLARCAAPRAGAPKTARHVLVARAEDVVILPQEDLSVASSVNASAGASEESSSSRSSSEHRGTDSGGAVQPTGRDHGA